MNTQTTQPQPAPSTGKAKGKSENVVPMQPAAAKPTNMLADIASAQSAASAAKMQHLKEAREHLKAAVALSGAGNDKASEARDRADKAAVILYQDRVAGVTSADEVTGMLGDAFGFKGKGDGKGKVFPAGHNLAGRTPAGLGEPIRKRIVRMADAYTFATSPDGSAVPSFFEGMDKAEVAKIVNNVDNGKLSTWSAYDRFAEDKRALAGTRVNPAFDSKRVLAIASALSEPSSIDKLISDPGLWSAYGTLQRVFNIVFSDERLIAAYLEANTKAA